MAQFSSLTDVELKLGFSADAVASCCHDISNTSYGYRWEFAEQVMEGEEWRHCNGLDVSNFGRVRLPNGRVTHGYKLVNNNRVAYRVHDLVCEAYHGKRPSADHVVNHRDERSWQ
jgi:hypothetical protein